MLFFSTLILKKLEGLQFEKFVTNLVSIFTFFIKRDFKLSIKLIFELEMILFILVFIFDCVLFTIIQLILLESSLSSSAVQFNYENLIANFISY